MASEEGDEVVDLAADQAHGFLPTLIRRFTIPALGVGWALAFLALVLVLPAALMGELEEHGDNGRQYRKDPEHFSFEDYPGFVTDVLGSMLVGTILVGGLAGAYVILWPRVRKAGGRYAVKQLEERGGTRVQSGLTVTRAVWKPTAFAAAALALALTAIFLSRLIGPDPFRWTVSGLGSSRFL